MKPVIGPNVASPREPTIEVAGHSVTSRVAGDIHAASKKTGTSFSFLMAQAAKESGFASEAKSRQSSAAGLFQFTRQTWFQMVKTHGADHGLNQFSDAITRSSNGEYTVADPEMRKAILDLRRDPQVSSLMAGEYAKDNEAYLQKKLGRDVGDADLYMAHFLGPAGAAKLLKAREQDAQAPAAEILPKAAKANPTIFYTEKSPRSVAAVYDKMRNAIERPSAQFAKLEGRLAGTETTAGTPDAAASAPVRHVAAATRTDAAHLARTHKASRAELAAAPTTMFPPAELGIFEEFTAKAEDPDLLMAESETIPAGSGASFDALTISQPMPPRHEPLPRPTIGGETAERLRSWARGIFG